MIYEQRWWTVTNEANSRYSPSPIFDLPSDAVRYQVGSALMIPLPHIGAK